jgi:pimeloyl-ACP methyl ester carboxylesterase
MSTLGTHVPERYRRPRAALFALEPIRATAELAVAATCAPLARVLPRGDGRSVFVLPGFTASDRSTVILRKFLSDLGYDTHGWHLGANLGPTQRVLTGILDGFAQIRRRSNGPVTVIGWSLGGLYARALAARSPRDVRHVITLGSPFRMASRADSNAATLYRALSALHVTPMDNQLRHRSYEGPPPVWSTSIFSKTDGVVPWETCLDDAGPTTENIEVQGAHVGLGYNPAALKVIADRLQLGATWAPYRANRAERVTRNGAPFLR